jgi:hypothetical protein
VSIAAGALAKLPEVAGGDAGLIGGDWKGVTGDMGVRGVIGSSPDGSGPYFPMRAVHMVSSLPAYVVKILSTFATLPGLYRWK